MNFRAAMIAAGLGAAYLAAEILWDYRPSWLNFDPVMDVVFSSSDPKARAAVSRLLINPASADFSALRTVELDKTKFVCGAVKAKDRSGYHGAYHDFVYTVATDHARIDDDGLITHEPGAFTACPTAPEEKPTPPKILPEAVSAVKAIEKAVPLAASSGLATMASKMPAGGGNSPGGSLEQQVGHMANRMTAGLPPGVPAGSAGLSGSTSQPGPASRGDSAGQRQASSTSKAALVDESEWRSDQPPSVWPVFPFDHPLARPARKRTTSQAIALAKDIEDRWAQSRHGNAKARPSSGEIQEACRALLAINPNDSEFPNAWGAFLRLRKITRDSTT